MFVNWKNGKVLDVSGGKDLEGQAVWVWKKHGGKNQTWKVVYLDKATAIIKKGVNEDFGFHVNRPFYIVSRLPMQRVVQAQGNNNIALNRWVKNRAAQQWWFDPVSKTIRSQHWKNYCMEIPSSGAANELRITGTISSRWW